MELKKFMINVLGEGTHIMKMGGNPNAICVSREMYEALEEDFKANFKPIYWQSENLVPTLCGMRVFISDGLHGAEFIIGKVRTKTD